jgi:SNF2 family DNA or RNA helicase
MPRTMYRVLIICPNQVRFNWEQEFLQFATVAGKTSVLRGDEVSRTRKLNEGIRDEDDCYFGAVMLGHDSVGNTLEAIRRVPWDLVVWDESHYVKNHRTERFSANREFLSVGHVRQRMVLSGTPIANTLMDLWTQLELLGEGLSGFATFKHFRAFHGSFVRQRDGTGTAIEKLIGLKNIPLIQERLSRLTFMITKEQAGMNLPEKIYDTIEVEMTPQQATWYKQVKNQLAIELEDILNGDAPKRMTADHVLTKLLRLAHITSGFVTWDAIIDTDGVVVSPKREETIPGPNPKIDELVACIKADFEDDPLGKKIVWASWKHDLREIAARFREEGFNFVEYHGSVPDAQRPAVIAKYNLDPKCNIILGNPQTLGTGTNLLGYDPANPDSLPTYTDHEFFFSQGWQPVLRGQAEDRAHRKGTRTILRITDFVVPGTVDVEIRARVRGKLDDASMIQDVRDILRNVLENL